MGNSRDDNFDYFTTSDGHLWRSPRNFERERQEAEGEQSRLRVERFNAVVRVVVNLVIGVLVFTLIVLLFS